VLLRPDVLEAISDLEVEMQRDPQIGGVTSIADHVKRMHQELSGDPTNYAIPADAQTVGEYLFLRGMSTGPDGLSAYMDTAYRRAVIRSLSKIDNATFSHDLLQRLQAYANQRFRNLPVTVGIAGGTLGAQTAMNDLIVHEKVLNMIQVAAIILVLCAI